MGRYTEFRGIERVRGSGVKGLRLWRWSTPYIEDDAAEEGRARRGQTQKAPVGKI